MLPVLANKAAARYVYRHFSGLILGVDHDRYIYCMQ
jgi:hypothetical protein